MLGDAFADAFDDADGSMFTLVFKPRLAFRFLIMFYIEI